MGHGQRVRRMVGALAVLLAGVGAAGAVAGVAGRFDSSAVPGTVITHSPASSRVYLGSPSIVALPGEGGVGGTYVVSHDTFGAGSDLKTTRLFRSADRGRTWEMLATVGGQYWSTLFVHRGALYLMGTNAEYGQVVIRRSEDGGKTWTTPRDEGSGLLRADGRFHCGPVPVIEHGGRVWRAMEDAKGPGGWGSHFRAFMMSAPADADLLKAASWTSSEPLAGDARWLGGTFNGWLEGNAVATHEGELVDILRVDDGAAGERAAVVKISADGQRGAFDAAKDFVRFPGGAKKFTIRFDARTGRYWSLVNDVMPARGRVAVPGGIRNTLSLVSSADLREWTVRCVLLHHPDREHVAFQYPDWQFEGEDLIAAIRTAHDDGLGGASRGHDANFITFHRIRDFRRLTVADSVAVPEPQPVTIEHADFSVSGYGFEIATLAEGGKAFLNREYTWGEMPATLKGWRYTRTAGGEAAEITVKGKRAGTVMAATVREQAGLALAGWEALPGMSFTYSDRGRSRMVVFRRTLEPGKELVLPQGNWSGLVLLLPPEGK